MSEDSIQIDLKQDSHVWSLIPVQDWNLQHFKKCWKWLPMNQQPVDNILKEKTNHILET